MEDSYVFHKIFQDMITYPFVGDITSIALASVIIKYSTSTEATSSINR
jgi:hypothetical protein